MAINKKLISFATQAQFDAFLANNNIDNRSIVFIEDKKRIWSHGVYFDTSWTYLGDKPSTFAPAPHTLDSHSNVVVTANTAGEILKWSGTNWINNTLAEAGIASVTQLDNYLLNTEFLKYKNIKKVSTLAEFTSVLADQSQFLKYIEVVSSFTISANTTFNVYGTIHVSGTLSFRFSGNYTLTFQDLTNSYSGLYILDPFNNSFSLDGVGGVRTVGIVLNNDITIKTDHITVSSANVTVQSSGNDGGMKLAYSILKTLSGSLSGKIYQNSLFSLSDHTHTGIYEPIISTKNTAFNKNFGTVADTVAQGNDSRIINGQTAFGWGNHASQNYFKSNYLKSTSVSTYDANNGSDSGFVSSYNQSSWLTNGAFSGYGGLITWKSSNFGLKLQLHYDAGHTNPTGGRIAFRTSNSATNEDSYTNWKELWHSGNFNPANYLPLTGGTLTGSLTASGGIILPEGTQIKTSNNVEVFRVDATKVVIGASSFDSRKVVITGNPVTIQQGFFEYTVYHSGNFNPANYLPLTGGTLTGSIYNILELKRSTAAGSSILFSNSGGSLGKFGFTSNGTVHLGTGSSTDGIGDLMQIVGTTKATTFYGTVTAPSFSGSLIGNADTATKLSSIITTFTGTYPVAFNVNGSIYSNSNITYTGSTNTLTATNFNGNASSATNADMLDGYHLVSLIGRSVYYATNGVLVETTILATSNTMVYGRITGNSYSGAGAPIDTTFQFYNYEQGGYIINYSAVNNGYPITEIKAFNYNGLIYIYIPYLGAFQSINVELWKGGGSLKIDVTAGANNAAMPATGVTRLVTITPLQSALTTSNVASATILQTARTINGTSFDGSANITTANWGTARNISIGSTTKSVNGSANVSWSLAEIGAAGLSVGMPSSIAAYNAYWVGRDGRTNDVRGTQTPYVINNHTGISLSAHSAYSGIRLWLQGGSPYDHDGTLVAQFSTAINHYVHTAATTITATGTITAPTFSGALSGNASSATYASTVTLTADNATNATRYPLFASAATGNLSPLTDTGFTYNPSTGALTANTFIGNLTGNASSATTANRLNRLGDNRNSFNPSQITGGSLIATFSTQGALVNQVNDSDYSDVIAISSYQDGSAGQVNALSFDKSSYRINHFMGTFGASTWSGFKTLAYLTDNVASATNISNSGTVTLATATESNAITITQPSYVSEKPVKLLNFNWYATAWSLGNIRGGGTNTQGLGIYLDGVEKFRFQDGIFKIGSNTVYHSGNLSAVTLDTAQTITGSKLFQNHVTIDYDKYIGIAYSSSDKSLYNYFYGGSVLNLRVGEWTSGAINTFNIETKGGVKALSITNISGNVGIGEPSPSEKLDVSGNIKSSGKIDALSIGSKFGNAIASLPALGAEGNTFGIGSGYGFRFNVLTTGDGNLQIGRFSGGTNAYNLILQSQGGNVGIGQPSPAYKLDVNGTGRFTGALTASSTITATGNLLTSANVIANTGVTVAQTGGTGMGISLYSTAGVDSSTNPTYGIMFATTANKGTHGAVTGDWATYFTMSNTAGRGWIFTTAPAATTGNVASISNTGIFTGTGFSKTGISDSYVLLAGGGHKAVTDFASNTELASLLDLINGVIV